MRLIVLGLASFLGANLVFARFEKLARASVAKGVVDGLYDLGTELEQSRAGALRAVPPEVRGRIRAEINTQLTSAGITREQARAVVAALAGVRGERPTLTKLTRTA